MQNNVNAVFEQREKTGQPMIPHLNHPNFGWAVTAEDLMQVNRERFFEVYNGHPTVHNEGDETHASADRIWDIILTKRLTELHLEPLYGLATDDSHHYHVMGAGKNNPGQGWVQVRAEKLSPEKIIAAMEAGEFYASNGVRLKEVRREKENYSIEIEPENGVTYTVQFIGTRKGFDGKSEPIRNASGAPLPVTHRYSKEIGVVLSEMKGTSASYVLKGDEIYVRAKIISSKIKPALGKELETAWTQPFVTEEKKAPVN
ncbi:MAG: hypothetical protein M3Y82_04150, partial [Verrucomicrobiota bacterium]|nr:hypothetical protein [Verrucomicrobiota bacterium]